jgi:hypothetical protein
MYTWDHIDLGDDEIACPRRIRPLAERTSPRITENLEDDGRDAPCAKWRSTCPAKERLLASKRGRLTSGKSPEFNESS